MNSLKNKKRMLFIMGIFVTLFVILIIRLFWLQVVRAADLSQKAYEQQTRDSLISPKRGTIYDTNKKPLAISASVETIVVNPTNIKTDEDRQKIAKYFSDNYGLNYDETLETVSKTKSSSLALMKKVEKDVTDNVRQWISTEKIKGISIIEDTKRYYPFNNLASHIIGFCGTDNQGLYGIEQKYEKYLKGVPGKIVTAKDANNNEMPLESETYINPEDGYNITLTIDEVIQHTAERYLKQAVYENECQNGGVAIVMRPKTGEILAMTSMPDYNLNQPFSPNTDELTAIWDTMTKEEKINAQNAMWRNDAISDTYEPGSTFKVITSAIAVEEKIVDPDTPGFHTCVGHITIGGATMKCWRYYNPHGSQTLTNALQNSCNPAFVQLGLKIGKTTFYKYLRSFGLTERTGIDLPSESGSNFHKEEKVGSVELATLSFGQRFEITPLQLVAAVSSIANGGNLMKPMIIKEITDVNGNVIQKNEPVTVRQVLSKETSEKVLSMMESVVSIGTGKNAQIAGYKIGGKTGTGEQGTVNTQYVASFIGVAPTTNPEIVVLVALDQPTGAQGRQGGQIAAPVAQKIMTDILAYLEIPQDYEVESTGTTNEIQVPDVRTKTITEAIKSLQNLGFTVDINFDGDRNVATVVDQMPVVGTKLKKGSIVKLYAQDNDVRVSVTVPDLIAKTPSEAQEILKQNGLNMKTSGAGVVASQDPPSGTEVEQGTIIRLELKNAAANLE